jgi:glycosyltransferase involved in cell wall biosynthesis
MTRLRVLFLTTWYPTEEQPILGTFVREHAKAAAKHCDVVVVHGVEARRGLGRPWLLTREDRVDLTLGLPTYRLSRPLSPVPRTNFLLEVWAVWRALRHLSAGLAPFDLIHAHVYPAGAPAVAVGRLASVPVVVTEHSSAFPRMSIPPVEVWKARLAFQGACFALPVSRSLQRAIESHGIRARFEVVPNTYDEDVFFPSKEPRIDPQRARFVFVGRLTEEKGLPILLEALSGLRRGDWDLAVVGDGPARRDCEERADVPALRGRVRFHGELPKAQVAELLRSSDCLVLPSMVENLPCVIIEAMATGLPVLATRVDGIPELVDDESGILVEPADPIALAEGLLRMLDGLSNFDKGGILAKARPYGAQDVGRRLLAIYERCANRRTASVPPSE